LIIIPQANEQAHRETDYHGETDYRCGRETWRCDPERINHLLGAPGERRDARRERPEILDERFERPSGAGAGSAAAAVYNSRRFPCRLRSACVGAAGETRRVFHFASARIKRRDAGGRVVEK